MVFKGRFFSSKKSDSSNSPDGSNNSPRSLGSNSPIRSDKKKSKSASKDDPQGPTTSSGGAFGIGGASRQTLVKDGSKKKETKGKESQAQLKTPSKPGSTATTSTPKKSSTAASAAAAAEPAASVSPILASSLGLNRIKTRSGPLPQESFFGFRGDKGSSLGSSNLSRPGAVGDGSLGSGSGGKKKEAGSQSKIGFNENLASGSWVDNGSNSDAMSTGSVPSRDQSPNMLAPSRLQNGGESSAEAGMILSNYAMLAVL